MAVISVFAPGIASAVTGAVVWSFRLKLLVLVLTGATDVSAWGRQSSFPPILRPVV